MSQFAELLPPNLLFAALGDSITARNGRAKDGFVGLYNHGILTRLRAELRQRLDSRQALNFGVGGDTTGQMLARMGAAEASEAQALTFLGGTNDAAARLPLDTTFANYEAILGRARSRFALTVVMAVLPRSSWPAYFTPEDAAEGQRKLRAMNHWLRGYCTAREGVLFVDTFTPWLDPDTGGPRPGFTEDGVHQSTPGADAAALALAAALDPLLPAEGWPLHAGPEDGFDAATRPGGNKLHNPGLGGTDGAAIGGATGQVADRWVLLTSQPGNIGLVEGSKEAAADRLGDWQVVTITGRQGANESISLNSHVELAEARYAPGESLRAAVEFQLLDPVNVADPGLRWGDLPGTGAPGFESRDFCAFNGNIVGPARSRRGVLLTDPHQLLAPTGTGPQRQVVSLQINLVSSMPGGASGVVKFRRPTLRRVG
ncbi:SGNH/GDSL hydrolase family protein [Roseomonas sp. BN140053]|uniref:SGNH/GDSL hydrolase family protein n=1 Tax=Roseomonas sp. BN140053 TaxID=3391898 RepID=UPI0039EA6CB0